MSLFAPITMPDARCVDVDLVDLRTHLGLGHRRRHHRLVAHPPASQARALTPARRCRVAAACPRRRSCCAAAYAASRADCASAPSAVTPSTRPPAVSSWPSARAVPAWVTSTSAARRRGPRSPSPLEADAGSPRSRAPRSPPTRAPTRSARSRSPPGRVAASSSSSRSERRRGSTACVSGSPKRTLNSSTRGPSAVSISAGVEDAVEGRAARAHQLDDRLVDLLATICATPALVDPAATGE